jgi:perosamine synthetase
MHTSIINKMDSFAQDKSRLFYHLPPTAVLIKGRDFCCGIRAIINPRTSRKKYVAALEEKLGTPNIYLTGSGRLALVLILLTIKSSSKRSKVIIPAYSCPTVAQAVLDTGLQPVFCDVSPKTLDLDREFLSRLLDNKTLAIIPTHLYGLAQDLSDLAALGREQGIFIVEDGAQAFGAAIHGTPVGNAGDFGFFSQGWGKCIPTGQGGIIISKERWKSDLEKTINKTISGKIRRDFVPILKLLGYSLVTSPAGWWFIIRSPWNPAGGGMDLDGLPPIRRISPGSAQNGIGLSILYRINEINDVRIRNADLLIELMSSYPFVSIPELPPDSQPVFLRLPILVENKARSDQIYQRMTRAGIGVSRSYERPLPDIFSNLTDARSMTFPGAEYLANCLLTLPTHHHLDARDITRIGSIFESYNV